MKSLFRKIFVVEGNIGAGKTTILKELEKAIPRCAVLYEPVERWKNVNGGNLLDKFYSNPQRWAFTFELESMASKVRELKRLLNSEAEVIIMERSIFSDKAFQTVSFLSNKLSSMETSLLDDLRKDFMYDYPSINAVFYLDVDPKVCLERIKKRGRKEELGITKGYLEILEKQLLKIQYGCPLVMLNGEADTKNILDSIIKYINKTT